MWWLLQLWAEVLPESVFHSPQSAELACLCPTIRPCAPLQEKPPPRAGFISTAHIPWQWLMGELC